MEHLVRVFQCTTPLKRTDTVFCPRVERVFQGVPPHHNGSHETAGGDGAIVDERVFFWDEDSGGDPK